MNNSEQLTRSATLADDGISAVIATSTPVQRRDSKGAYLEILDPAGLQPVDDLPVVMDHTATAANTIGRASDITPDGESVRATITLSDDPALASIRARVADKTLKHLSIGYRVAGWREGKDTNGTRTATATIWTIHEISLVAVPADINAQLHRSNTGMPNTEEQIRALAELAGQTRGWAEDLIDEGVDLETARQRAREALAPKTRVPFRPSSEQGSPDAFRAAAVEGLSFRAGLTGDLSEQARAYSNMSFKDLARESLTRAGVSHRGMSDDELLHRAAHGTSDFALIVSGVAGKSLLDAYQLAQSPLKQLARSRTLPNFKTATSIRLGEMGQLEELSEHGEFTATSRAESGETLQLATFGRRFDLTRKLMIDDDLGAFNDITAALGRAAAATETALLLQTVIGNPVMSDGKTAFHADHGNTSAPAALSVEAISAARLAMRKRVDLDGVTKIDASPKYLLVGPELETAAEQVLADIYATTPDGVNPFSGKLQLLVEPGIADESWYLFADPAKLAGLQYGYLTGQQGPQIQRQEAWNTLGVSFRVYLDFGAGWLDYRAAQFNAGA